MNKEKLQKILEEHKKWLEDEDTGERANLANANLAHANLENANLENAYLAHANLENANLENAKLARANLAHANLAHAYLDDKEKCRLGVILNKSIIGYKKSRSNAIIKLQIPKGAIVFSINNNECRTNKCKVLEIEGGDDVDKEIAYSIYDMDFAYKVGKKIEIKDFNLQYNIECTSGIHFFKTREEAEKY